MTFDFYNGKQGNPTDLVQTFDWIVPPSSYSTVTVYSKSDSNGVFQWASLASNINSTIITNDTISSNFFAAGYMPYDNKRTDFMYSTTSNALVTSFYILPQSFPTVGTVNSGLYYGGDCLINYTNDGNPQWVVATNGNVSGLNIDTTGNIFVSLNCRSNEYPNFVSYDKVINSTPPTTYYEDTATGTFYGSYQPVIIKYSHDGSRVESEYINGNLRGNQYFYNKNGSIV
jgi:hypothetical protein